jgi:hypothetical protein
MQDVNAEAEADDPKRRGSHTDTVTSRLVNSTRRFDKLFPLLRVFVSKSDRTG